MSQPSTPQNTLQTCLGRQGVQELFLNTLEATFEDKRIDRTKSYPLVYILFAALCTFITGGSNFYDMQYFSRDYKDFVDKVTGYSPPTYPSHDTFNRIFKMVNPEHMCKLLRSLVELLQLCLPIKEGEEHFACDGKFLRGSKDNDDRMQGILNIWSSKTGMIILKVPVDTKSNEITAIPKGLELLNLKGCVVTFDAMNTQRTVIDLIAKKGGYYLAPLKANHRKANDEIQKQLQDIMEKKSADLAVTTKSNGRLDTRRVWQDEDIAWFADRPKWRGLTSIVAIELDSTHLATEAEIQRLIRQAKKENKVLTRAEATDKATTSTKTVTYYFTNLPKNPKRLLELRLEHWQVETEHYVLDVTMDEDANRTKDKNAAINLSVMRNCALNLLKHFRAKNEAFKKDTIKSLRRAAAANRETLLSILFDLEKTA